MKKIRLNVLGLTYSQTQSGAYALLLSEEDGDRRLPIIIGGYEAQAIAIELEGLTPPRPLTHDLLVTISKAVDVAISEVVVYKLEEGIFYSEIVINKDGKQIRIDSRTSDAIALALRFKCPIYTSEEIIDKAGIVLDVEPDSGDETIEQPIKEKSRTSKKSNKYSSLKLNELQDLLDKAIEDEDYEKASEIRDELTKRSTEE